MCAKQIQVQIFATKHTKSSANYRQVKKLMENICTIKFNFILGNNVINSKFKRNSDLCSQFCYQFLLKKCISYKKSLYSYNSLFNTVVIIIINMRIMISFGSTSLKCHAHDICECNDYIHCVFVHVIDFLVLNLEILKLFNKLFLLKLDVLHFYFHIWVWILSMDATRSFVLFLVVSTAYLFLE